MKDKIMTIVSYIIYLIALIFVIVILHEMWKEFGWYTIPIIIYGAIIIWLSKKLYLFRKWIYMSFGVSFILAAILPKSLIQNIIGTIAITLLSIVGMFFITSIEKKDKIFGII